jgi:hypothetical protein
MLEDVHSFISVLILPFNLLTGNMNCTKLLYCSRVFSTTRKLNLRLGVTILELISCNVPT